MQDERQVALVTGASSGIGLATAQLFAAEGFRVFGTSRTPEAHPVTDCTMVELDVHSEDSCTAAVSRVLEEAGRIDVLVNNAGYGLIGALEEFSIEEIHQLFETNVYGLVRMTQAVLPSMRARRHGRIINISSTAGRLSIPFESLYCASKFTVEGLSEGLRHELRPFGIAVCLVEPGFTRSHFKENIRQPKQTIDDYNTMRQEFLFKVGNAFDSGNNPETIAAVILRAARDKKPKLRYPAGGDAVMATFARRWFSDSMIEKVIGKSFGGGETAGRK